MTEEFKYAEPKYRQYRWVLEVPGIPAQCMIKIDMPNGHRMMVDFCYINDMDIGKCPIPSRENAELHSGVLQLLNADGDTIRQAQFRFAVEDYVPALELDYRKSDYVTGRVVLWILNPIDWNS